MQESARYSSKGGGCILDVTKEEIKMQFRVWLMAGYCLVVI